MGDFKLSAATFAAASGILPDSLLRLREGLSRLFLRPFCIWMRIERLGVFSSALLGIWSDFDLRCRLPVSEIFRSVSDSEGLEDIEDIDALDGDVLGLLELALVFSESDPDDCSSCWTGIICAFC